MRQRRIKLVLNNKVVGSRTYILVIKLIMSQPLAEGDRLDRFLLENDQKKSYISRKSCLKSTS